MKYLRIAFFTTLFLVGCDSSQLLTTVEKDILSSGLSDADIASGLKEALSVGVQNGTGRLSATDGFFKDAAMKILLPPEAKDVEDKLRSFGMGSLVDKAILSLNRSAEDASKTAAPIFKDAITNMSITDALGILKGGGHSATDYFQQKTTASLKQAFTPIIQNALDKNNATKYWKDVFTAYNTFSSKPVNTDLVGYVADRAIQGIFTQVQTEEQNIRQNPLARTSDLLKKVFGSSAAQGK